MAKLPISITEDKDFNIMQTKWASAIEPVLSNPLVNGNVLQNVALVTGSNTINHLLGRKLQGWCIIRQRANASIWDTQDTNSMPALTLLLTSSANVSIDLYVF